MRKYNKMESNEDILLKILSKEEVEGINNVVRDKLEKYFSERFEEFLTAKAVGEAAKNNIDQVREEFEKQIQEFKSQIEDYEAKLDASLKNANELRNQLDAARQEITKLLEKSKQYEVENSEFRRTRNEAVDERDSLLNMVDRRNAEVERLQSEIKTYETQLQSAITAKCEALAKLDEIEGKEVSLNFKEKRMEQERTIMTNQINSLSDDLNRKIAELQSIRRDNTIRNLELETKLNEKIEEVKIANSTIEHLNETVGSLTMKAEELAAKLLAQGEESAKMMNYYKKELDAKTKLADLYKETNDDHISQAEELTKAVTELKKLLTDASDQYGALETKLKETELQHEQAIEEKDEIIKKLRDEIKHANNLLEEAKSEFTEQAVANIAPTAAVTSRLIKSDLSLTELYSMYVKATEDFQLEKKKSGHLELQIQSILQELEEKAPIIKKQSIDYQKLREANAELLEKLDSTISNLSDERFRFQEMSAKCAKLERENQQLLCTQKDLSRQVCFLVNEVDMTRLGGGSENEQSISSDMSANEVISKKLITFRDTKELQENNQKLILLVRDLSSKLEEIEENQNSIDQAAYESKLNTYAKRLEEMQVSQEYHMKMLNTCMDQRDRYKKLFHEARKAAGEAVGEADKTDNMETTQEDMEGIDEEPVLPSSSATSSVISSEVKTKKDKKVQELDEKVNDLKAQLQKVKEEYEEYRKEKLTNEKMMNEQFDSMRTELRELTSNNCKLMSTVENLSEQIQIQQKNVSTYKKQIATLEERNKNYENTIIKHEQTIMVLKDETFKSQKELSSKEVQYENLKQENRILHDAQTRLQLEREAFHRERQTQSILMNNIEMIKASFERSETEGRLRMESRLDEITRECSALRRRLQEEQDRFRELSSDLKRQTETAKQRMNEEKSASDGLRDEVNKLREEVIEKTKQIDELSKKLQESLTPSKNDNPIAQANKKAREMSLKYEEARLEIETLTKQLEAAREHGQQYSNIASSVEKELKDLHDIHKEYKEKAEEELKKLRLSESNLKTRVDELETEIQLQITNEKINSNTTPVQIQKVKGELKDALQKISELSREIRDLREENSGLSTSLSSVEQKYANEMILHSTDIQQLATVKEELNKVREQINSLKSEKEKAISELCEKQKGWEEYEKRLSAEKEEIEKRLVDLDSQNATLHDQLQALSTKLSIANIDQSVNESMNDSSMTEHNASVRSIPDDEGKGNDQLLQIIKYLRKEKDIAMAKLDIFKSENARLVSEQSILQKKVQEANSVLNSERSKSEVVAVTTARHEEILRKVETLNAITDSNRILREERDILTNRVKELTERVTKVEDELFPLQEKNRELTVKIEETQAENNSLRTEALRWRQRANLLVERSNKNPEDFKRLQTERESLAKMLTVEKDALKQAQEELNTIKAEKTRLDNEVANLGRQITSLTEEKKKITEEFNSLKQQNARLTHEIMELKNHALERDDELKKITEELAARDVQLAEAKNKEFQIRKIAKRYKDSFIELKNKEDGKDPEAGADPENPTAGEISGTSKPDTEKELKDKINELNSQITTIQEENENLKKENESLKANLEREERNRQLLKEAKARIINLTESKTSVARELSVTKTQLQTLEQQTREEHDIALASLKQQYESRISRQEKEHTDQEKELRENINCLTRENEILMLRINQLHRQLGMQQTSKPSTSSGQSSDKSPTEAPRTANVKPMSGPSGQQSATVTPWRAGETPLASIRPMSVQNRTAAVLPTSQTSNVAAIQGSSSSTSSSSTSGSVTALVPPQQQVHTTGNSSGEAMSSSPTSSHTDYMPATSSAAIVVATIPPMGANAAESSQEAESVQAASNESSSSQVLVSGGQQQQAVALVSPRVEGTAQNVVPPQSVQAQDTNQPSTSGTSSTSSSSNISVTSHHQASSSNTVTTTQAGGHKRPRDVEGDSSTSNEEGADKSQQNKRTRVQAGEATFQGVSESGLDVEYQVPTSSQRDQEDDVIIVDSEDDGMVDEGPADADEDPMDDEADNGEGYEMEESYEQEQDIDEGEGPDIDEDNVQSNNNEVEVDDSSEVPNQSGTSSSNNHVAPDAGTSTVDQSSNNDQTEENRDVQQIQAISSGTNEAGSSSQSTPQSCWRHNPPLSRQQQQTVSSYLMLQQSNYEETGDDGIVPSTPTLYVPRRTDGEAVSSPHPQVPHAARFTFSESSSTTTTTRTSTGAAPEASSNVEGGIDETRIDLTEEVEGSAVPSTQQQTSPSRGEASAAVVEGSTTSTTTPEKSEQAAAGSSQEDDAGPSHSEGQIPEITVTTAVEDAEVDEDATTSDVNEGSQLKMDDDDIEEGDDEEGLDGVTSEGEKAGGSEEQIEMEEGREAEASSSPTVNLRSRSVRNSPPLRRTNRNVHQRPNRITPIVWQDHSRTGRNVNQNVRGSNEGNMQRGAFQPQRGQRSRRPRRGTGHNFGGNMRF